MILFRKYYPICETYKQAAEVGKDTPKAKSLPQEKIESMGEWNLTARDIDEQVRDGEIFLQADALAWSILSNSFNAYQNNENNSLESLLYESMRLYCTASVDLWNRKKHSTCATYFYNRLDASQFVLASILSALDFQSTTPFCESVNEHHQYLISLGSENWYFRVFLAECSSLNDDEEMVSLLDVDEQTVEAWKTTGNSKTVPDSLATLLKKTALYKILDRNERKSRLFHMAGWTTYNIYLGDIDAYTAPKPKKESTQVKGQKQKKNKQKTYLNNKGSKPKKKKSSPPKAHNKKESTSEKTDNTKTTSTNTSGSQIKVKEKEEDENSSQEEETQEHPSEFANTSSSSSTYLNNAANTPGDWTVITHKKERSKQPKTAAPVRLTIEEMKQLCTGQKLHHLDYAHIRNMSLCTQSFDSYSYNGVSHSTQANFSTIKSTISKEKALQFAKYFADKHDYKSIRVDKNERVPNVARFFMTFHLLLNSKNIAVTFIDEDIYMSGAQLFKKPEESFKVQNRIKLAYNDILTTQEKSKYWKTTDPRQIYLKVKMTDQICNELVQGGWIFNALDSEAVMLLDLQKNKLYNYIANLSTSYPGALIQGAVLGISSYYECCFRCRNLMQGFQWKLESTLTRLLTQIQADQEKVTLSPHFNSMILFDGQYHVKHTGDNNWNVFTQTTLPSLDSNDRSATQQHKLVLFPTHQ